MRAGREHHLLRPDLPQALAWPRRSAWACPVGINPAPPAASLPYSFASSGVPEPSGAAIVSDVDALTNRFRRVSEPILPGSR